MNHLNIYTCPYCPLGEGGILLEKTRLPGLSRKRSEHQLLQGSNHLPAGVLTFGGQPEICEHLFSMELFLKQGTVGNDGLLQTNWSTGFSAQSSLMQQLEEEGIDVDFLFEEIYLHNGVVRQPEYRLVTPHVVTGWIEYRFRANCSANWWDLQFHGYFAENVTLFLHELNRLSSVRQERWELA